MKSAVQISQLISQKIFGELIVKSKGSQRQALAQCSHVYLAHDEKAVDHVNQSQIQSLFMVMCECLAMTFGMMS